MHIGNKIKEEVSKKNISVTDFAKLINKSRPYTYSIFEKENIDTELLIHISSVLNLSPASFFEDITHSVMQMVQKTFWLVEITTVIYQLMNVKTSLKMHYLKLSI